MTKLEEQQEVLAGITDVLMNAFAMESAMLRAQKIAGSGKSARECERYARRVFARSDGYASNRAARTVLAACSEGDALADESRGAEAVHEI